jgi:hypothetical protein
MHHASTYRRNPEQAERFPKMFAKDHVSQRLSTGIRIVVPTCTTHGSRDEDEKSFRSALR